MSQDLFAGSRLLSKPVTPQDTKVEVLRRFINRSHGLHLKDYYELHEYSVTDYTFWLDLWRFLGIISSVPPTKVLGEGYIKEVPQWFPGARLNYAENMLWRTDDGIAITETNETGHVASYSYRQLRELVRKLAVALKLHGLQPGDRVAAIVANRTTSVAIALATASLGGIFTSTATDMGVKVSPFRRLFKILSSKGLGHVILLPGIKSGQEVSQEVVNTIPRSKTLSAFLGSDDGRPLTFEQLPFDHPLYILYSSGTTGPPKCIVHSGGGVLIQTKKELVANLEVGMDDTYFQFTTTAWMMWPYMLAGLACGARMIVYEGSPFYPDVKTYLEFIDKQNVNVFGTSPRFIHEVQGRGILPRRDIGKFEAMRRITTTGSVLSTPQYGWMRGAFNDRTIICAGSGGTDICGAFISSVPSLPVHAGEMQGKVLGMAVGIFDEAGKDISETGLAGELVCTRPHPSIPVRFWGDDARGSSFLKAYYDTYPGVWRHGDFIAMNPRTKGLIILGRSDGVLNPSGVRFGSGEIYGVLERPTFSVRIDDAICVGQRRPQDKDERVLLFIKMRAGHKLDPPFEEAIRGAIRSALSSRHVPAYIFEVKELPYTVNGKKIEIAVKKIVSGMRVVPSATVANPESLESYYKYQDIEKLAQASKKGNGRDAKL
ncbi:acetoacetate-CoA ligase [Lactarius psammicola]|nr:acetoacetate-CoA ligase [Lactarius psammicola]